MPKIMLVDDEPMILKAIKREIKQSEYELVCFENSGQAAKSLEVEEFDLIISDYRMPGVDGIQLLELARVCQPDALRIILSGESDLEFLKEAINRAEIYRFLSKPWDAFDLKASVQQALDFVYVKKHNEFLLKELHDQESKIQKQQKEIERLEKLNPGITQVSRDADGSILIDHD